VRVHTLKSNGDTSEYRLSSPAVRVKQFVRSILTRSDPEVDASLRSLLANDEQYRFVTRLSPYDRAHLLRVHDLVRDAGWDNPDLLTAALLHDIGKADQRARVRAWQRVAIVVTRRFLAENRLRMIPPNLPRPLHGLYLGIHHAPLGAELARMAGATPAACSMIRDHERRDAQGNPALLALIAADEAGIG
jgi:hypothetical protein